MLQDETSTTETIQWNPLFCMQAFSTEEPVTLFKIFEISRGICNTKYHVVTYNCFAIM